MVRILPFFCLLSALLFMSLSTSLPVSGQTAAPSGEPEVLTGTIVETMNASGYTYMLIDNGSRKQWVAIPESQVQKGEKVAYYAGMIMPQFTSKTLNRTFDNIVFSPGLAKAGSAPMAEVKKPAEKGDADFAKALQEEQKKTAASPTEQPSSGSVGAIVPFQEQKVAKAGGENGYSVEEVFAKRLELKGKKVRVRGNVVKVSPNIMGRNWVHLQDGSGNPINNTHDLVVTTNATPEQGSVVTLEGIVAADKDFGAGYSYSVIVEQANLVPDKK